jgi:hypothetical protein
LIVKHKLLTKKTMKKLKENKNDLQEEEPDIPGLSKGMNGFKVPEGYFDSLPGRIMVKAEMEKDRQSNPGRMHSMVYSTKVWIPLLAAASIIFTLFFILPESKKTEDILSQVHDTMNLNNAYDASYAGDVLVADYKIMDVFLEQLSADQEISFDNLYYTEEEISNEAIIEYLNEQEIDIDLLAEL